MDVPGLPLVGALDAATACIADDGAPRQGGAPMSHKATNWLARLEARQISASEFRGLFHLCDCHNPSQGRFPTQAYLLEANQVADIAAVRNVWRNNGLHRRNSIFRVCARQFR